MMNSIRGMTGLRKHDIFHVKEMFLLARFDFIIHLQNHYNWDKNRILIINKKIYFGRMKI